MESMTPPKENKKKGENTKSLTPPGPHKSGNETQTCNTMWRRSIPLPTNLFHPREHNTISAENWNIAVLAWSGEHSRYAYMLAFRMEIGCHKAHTAYTLYRVQRGVERCRWFGYGFSCLLDSGLYTSYAFIIAFNPCESPSAPWKLQLVAYIYVQHCRWQRTAFEVACAASIAF